MHAEDNRGKPALCLARHGARLDYALKAEGSNWCETAERPWDPPLTEQGQAQGTLLGEGIRNHMERLGRRPVSRIITSPLLRCVQTASAAAYKLGVPEICLEPALAEGMLEDWFRSWAIPGADSTWGGPPGARNGTPLAAGATLHSLADRPAGSLLLSPAEATEALRSSPDFASINISSSYVPLSANELGSANEPLAGYRWGTFETEAALAARMEAALAALAARYLPNAWCASSSVPESILCCSHGGPCAHAYQELLKDRAVSGLNAGYTALYCFVREASDDGTDRWAAPIAADQGHLASMESTAPRF